jgi:hypothetical protein
MPYIPEIATNVIGRDLDAHFTVLHGAVNVANFQMCNGPGGIQTRG